LKILKAFYKIHRPDNAYLNDHANRRKENVVTLSEKKLVKFKKPPPPQLRDSYTEEPPHDGKKDGTSQSVGDPARSLPAMLPITPQRFPK